MEETMQQRRIMSEAKAPGGWKDKANIQRPDEVEDGDSQRAEWAKGTVRSVGEEDRQRTNGDQAETKEVHASSADLRRLLEKQDYKCAACCIDLTPDVAEIDHIVSRSDGGGNEPSNLQWLCRPCNRAKGDMSMTAFVAMVERIAQRRSIL